MVRGVFFVYLIFFVWSVWFLVLVDSPKKSSFGTLEIFALLYLFINKLFWLLIFLRENEGSGSLRVKKLGGCNFTSDFKWIHLTDFLVIFIKFSVFVFFKSCIHTNLWNFVNFMKISEVKCIHVKSKILSEISCEYMWIRFTLL
jgi:hypothetical protein